MTRFLAKTDINHIAFQLFGAGQRENHIVFNMCEGCAGRACGNCYRDAIRSAPEGAVLPAVSCTTIDESGKSTRPPPAPAGAAMMRPSMPTLIEKVRALTSSAHSRAVSPMVAWNFKFTAWPARLRSKHCVRRGAVFHLNIGADQNIAAGKLTCGCLACCGRAKENAFHAFSAVGAGACEGSVGRAAQAARDVAKRQMNMRRILLALFFAVYMCVIQLKRLNRNSSHFEGLSVRNVVLVLHRANDLCHAPLMHKYWAHNLALKACTLKQANGGFIVGKQAASMRRSFSVSCNIGIRARSASLINPFRVIVFFLSNSRCPLFATCHGALANRNTA